jgi:pimeloyl-ACP methyl ester carboxylesterase
VAITPLGIAYDHAAGAGDLATTRDSADRMCEGLAAVRRVDWPDVAHLPSLEQPDRFLALLLEWVANPG